jgi:NodT family efflux transporter outer membrane factor (OMF) lipoprotein
MQRTNLKPLTLLLGTLILSGCAQMPYAGVTGSEQLEPELISTPDTFVELDNIQFQSADDRNWVASFHSSELESLIEQGLANNPALAATATRVLDSEILAGITNSRRRPNLNVGVTGARAKSNVSGTSFIGNNFDLGFSSQWELDIWRKLKDQARADLIQAEATEQEYQAARLSLSANIAKAYFNLLTESELLNLAQQNTQNVERIEAITVRSFKSGLVNALDVQLARRDLANSRRALLDQENVTKSASRVLDVFLGEYPNGSRVTQQQNVPELPYSIHTGIPAEVLERRPDLQAAALRMLAKESDVAAARKALLPSIVLTGNFGTNANAIENILDSDFSVWSLLANISQPLLNRTALTGNLQLEKNAEERSKLEYIDLALRAMNEVETSLATENSLRQQVTELTTARDYAKQSSLQAQQQYEKGLVNANTLLSTETQYLNSEQTLLRIKNQLLQNRVVLYVALGGDVYNQASTQAEITGMNSTGETP